MTSAQAIAEMHTNGTELIAARHHSGGAASNRRRQQSSQLA
jgi:hypothetical protein